MEPIEYIDLGKGMSRSLASAASETLIRQDIDDDSLYKAYYVIELLYPGQSLTWPFDEYALARSGVRRWWAVIDTIRNIADDLLMPDRVARPDHQLLLDKDEHNLLKFLRKFRKVELWEPKGERRVGLETEKDDRGMMICRRISWLPVSRRPDQLECDEYSTECTRLQATKAGRKAKRLLMDNLTADQQRDYYTKGVFVVGGNNRSRPHYYVLDNSFPNGNIFEIEKGRPVSNYCFHPAEPYPMDDILLTQKMMIETDEEGFRKEANRSARDPKDYFMPNMNGYPISTAVREWSAPNSFVPAR